VSLGSTFGLLMAGDSRDHNSNRLEEPLQCPHTVGSLLASPQTLLFNRIEVHDHEVGFINVMG
jgi:hypothetical protein